MRILFDTNVVLDLLLARPPHVAVAAQLFNLVDRGAIEGYLCATTVTTIHYLAERAVGPGRARGHVTDLLAMFDVAPVDRLVLDRAQNAGFADFEDAVLHEAGHACQVGGIVTRNLSDFAGATIPIFDPPRLLAAVRAAAMERDR